MDSFEKENVWIIYWWRKEYFGGLFMIKDFFGFIVLKFDIVFWMVVFCFV